ncbi:MAG TPA: hypothetical protein VFD77_06195 [Brumimicrobium sp.]|nr:hypothetical protein [Brumimicrobium sp.]
MRLKIHFSILLGAVTVLSSCSNYGYISENDVYMQAPTEVNLEEDENDLTSFNAFKAREKGEFRDEYRDPRANETMRFNQFSIMSSYMPYGVMPGMYSSMGFHGMGYSPYFSYGVGFYTGYGMGLRAMYGNHYGYYDMYRPYGFGYSPYSYGSGYYGSGYYGGGYYGGGYYNGIQNYTNPVPSQPVHYGNRNTISSASNRSSSYQKSYTKQALPVSTSAYNVNDQTLGTSRREVGRRYAGSSDYSNNGKPNTGNFKSSQSGNIKTTGAVQQSRVNQNYTPNSSARRSGAVQTQRSLNVNPSRSPSRSINSSPSQRTNSSPVQASPQTRGPVSTGSPSRVSPSTTRTSGSTNSSSGRR